MFDNSWQALLQPGRAETYFTAASRPAFRPLARAFDLGNAWWLAELSRLIYRDDSPPRPTRAELLRDQDLEEVWFHGRAGTTCALVQPRHGTPFTVLVFRGTSELRDWLINLSVVPTKWPSGGNVHLGFLRALLAVWHALRTKLQQCPKPWFVTGHSLGGALATLAGAALRVHAVYTFGAPRVGDAAFGATLADVPLLRVVNRSDLVPGAPPAGPVLQFTHAGLSYRLTDDGRLLHGDGVDDAGAATFAAGDRRWFDPAPFLADHAPVNYVAGLQRLL